MSSVADKLIGFYTLVEQETKEESQVQIYKDEETGEYMGKLYWMKSPYKADGSPKADLKHPDKYWHDRAPIGMPILKNFKYNEKKNKWDNGTIYNPGNGKTYKCEISFESEAGLKVRGYVGLPAFGVTAHWTKEEAKPVSV